MSEIKEVHPLKSFKWIALALIVVGLLGTVLGPVMGVMMKLWPIWIMLALGITTLALIQFGGEKVQEILAMPFVAKLGKGLSIASIITVIAIFIYSMMTGWLVENWGISQRSAWILLTVFLPISVGGFWLIFKDILPGDPQTIRRGFFSISFVVIGILAYSYYPNPNEFFDHKEGKAKFWVSDSEEKIYFSPGYGIEDGKQLREGTVKDVEKYRQENIIAKIKKIATKTSSQPAARMADYPICAGGSYDFSRTAVPGKVNVNFRTDCRTEVTLPPGVVFRTDPSADIKIIFIDGSQYIDGPGHQVWYGLKKGIFKMYGIKEAGILKITFERKS